ncbi:MAG TPA: lamin tail domain-containing protein, partial [Candidatus Hydrogenedentes bacterium]|nr:lamin tail domain-containing protein [Candidatus Hydrogenedentota bacterium]
RVAIRINPDASGTVSLNFFDLSQEPDHEWIELVNTSDEAVDLSGWKLEIGIPDAPGTAMDPVMADPNKSKWTIPPGTVIAPKGYLLLAFTEPENGDQFANGPDGNRFYDNGLGLKRSDDPPSLQNVTVPPIGTRMEPALANAISASIPALSDNTFSVFHRPNGNSPFIDNDGDGLSSINAVAGSPAVLAVDPDNTLAELATELNIRQPLRSALGIVSSVAATPGFARIVSLRNDQLFLVNSIDPDGPPYPPAGSADSWNLAQIVDEKDVARVLLRGGILPNYPDQDGYDNDGDGGYLVTRSTAWYFVPGILDTDGVDNNLDGYVDVFCGYGFGNPLPPAGFGNAPNQKPDPTAPNLPIYSEGVDEGRLALGTNFPRFRYGYGSYPINSAYDNVNSLESGVLPMAANPNLPHPSAVTIDYTQLFDPLNPVQIASRLWYGGDAESRNPYVAINPSCAVDALPATGPLDSPDWIAFAERRWNPGDCVVISLYAGEPSPETLVDRVTYNEYDVINRTIDDIAVCPYPESLARPTYWPPNHMALDFYRSLERKHPLYAGDLHGTSNRWEASDGAYDDWADSLSWFEAVQDRSDEVRPIMEAIDSRFNLTGDPALTNPHHNRNLRLFGHAMSGSPLRMNTTARLWENPPDLLAAAQPALYVEEELQINPALAYGPLEPSLTARLPLRQFSFYGITDAAFVEPDMFHGSSIPATLQEFWAAPKSSTEAGETKIRDFPAHLLRRARVKQGPYAGAGDWLDVPMLSFHYWMGRVVP